MATEPGHVSFHQHDYPSYCMTDSGRLFSPSQLMALYDVRPSENRATANLSMLMAQSPYSRIDSLPWAVRPITSTQAVGRTKAPTFLQIYLSRDGRGILLDCMIGKQSWKRLRRLLGSLEGRKKRGRGLKRRVFISRRHYRALSCPP
jgi:hypothetical protein